MTTRPRAVTFDVVETLFSLEALRTRLLDVGATPETLELWFARMLRDAFALTLTGDYRSMRDVAKNALSTVLPHEVNAAGIESVLGTMSDLEPHPDAQPALARLAEAGVAVFTLTNGGTENTEKLLANADLDSYVEAVISIEEVQMWKPARAPYLRAAEVAGVEPPELALVAVHAWDVHGAKRAGLTTGWAARLEGVFPPIFEAPDAQGASLVDVVDGLLRLGTS